MRDAAGWGIDPPPEAAPVPPPLFITWTVEKWGSVPTCNLPTAEHTKEFGYRDGAVIRCSLCGIRWRYRVGSYGNTNWHPVPLVDLDGTRMTDKYGDSLYDGDFTLEAQSDTSQDTVKKLQQIEAELGG